MLTTLVWAGSPHVALGAMRSSTSFSGTVQTVHGPVQKVASFLGKPGLDTGVNSHTLEPVVKVFLSLWY